MFARAPLSGRGFLPHYLSLALLTFSAMWLNPAFSMAARAPTPPPTAELAKDLCSIAE